MIPRDVPKVQYVTVEFAEHASMYDYLKPINYGLAKVSYMSSENRWSHVVDEIGRSFGAIRTMKYPELSSILEFRGTLQRWLLMRGELLH